jgi:WD40 repeat protein
MGGSFASTNGGTVQAALSPDGAMLAAVNVGAADGLGGLGNGSVQLWHVTGGHHSPIGGRFASDTQGAIFSPNARLLATIGEQAFEDGYGSSTYGSGPVRLWAVTGSHTPTPVGGPFAGANGGASAVAFSPDSKELATVTDTALSGSSDVSTVQLWNVAGRPQLDDTLASGISRVVSMAFSPDGTILATGSFDGTVRLWDVQTGQQIGSTLTDGTGNQVRAMAFSNGGATLEVYGEAAELWNVGYLADPLVQVCAEIGGSLSPAEWAEYAGPGPAYRNICRG